MHTYSHLQNGSDIRGVALPDGGSPVTLTPEAANRLAQGFGLWLAEKTGKGGGELCVGVGHDSRLTAESLKTAVASGLAGGGTKVYDCGLTSTPSMFMGTVFPETAFDGAIMLTASHLPFDRNGMKFFTRDGGLDKPEISEIIRLADGVPEQNAHPATRQCDLVGLYCKSLREKILAGVNTDGDKPLAGLHIVVDAGNGAGGFFVRDVLGPLGANVSGSQFLEPDGTFPNHEPNPENKDAMKSIRDATVKSGADIGIIFDTDVDRMSAVFPDGSEINRDSIIALMSAIIAPEYPGGTIVTDSVTSDRLTAFLEGKLKLRHHCFKRGYKNVINEAVRLNAEGVFTPLAIETSGHGAMKENYFLDDGAYLAVRLIIAAAKAKREGKSLRALLDGFTPAKFQRECRLNISGGNFGEYGATVLQTFASRAREANLRVVDSFEGVRISFGASGWALLRMSLHDPLMPLNAEGDTADSLTDNLAKCKLLLCEFDRLDLSSMT
jgi:phosphomannomutase